mmetsp:Transcript_32196/g.108408  ORF Transcript_32196/g.108408 Transcript_32196/m.108408 type:complete len:224 (+) Transcript_32196:481-1152(+)
MRLRFVDDAHRCGPPRAVCGRVCGCRVCGGDVCGSDDCGVVAAFLLHLNGGRCARLGEAALGGKVRAGGGLGGGPGREQGLVFVAERLCVEVEHGRARTPRILGALRRRDLPELQKCLELAEERRRHGPLQVRCEVGCLGFQNGELAIKSFKRRFRVAEHLELEARALALRDCVDDARRVDRRRSAVPLQSAFDLRQHGRDHAARQRHVRREELPGPLCELQA